MRKNDPAERTVRAIRRKTRKQYTAEEQLRIVVSGLRGEESIAAWCRREGIAEGHRQTQAKIERWHQTLQNRILLENYYLPGNLDNQISACVDHYHNQRYHESIGNVTPADGYFGRHTASIKKRNKSKTLPPQTAA